MNKLTLSTLAYQKLRAYIENCSEEISGLGKIKETAEGFELVDVKIFKQTVTGSTTNIDSDALGKFAYELQKSGEDMKTWVCWWHSHARMSAFFSTTDVSTIEQTNEQSYLISLVGNHSNEWEARLDIYKPHHATNELDVEIVEPITEQQKEVVITAVQKESRKSLGIDVNIEIEVEALSDTKITELCIQEVKQLVTEKVFQFQSPLELYDKDKKRTRRNDKSMNDRTLAEYNRKYHNMTRRQRFLVMKSHTVALTDDEAIEIAHLIDLTDSNKLYSFGNG